MENNTRKVDYTLNINQKIELKRECIDIPQAIRSGYRVVEVDRNRFCFSVRISTKYDVVPRYESFIVEKNTNTFGKYFIFRVYSGNKYVDKNIKNDYVKFIINMQEYGK